MENFLVGHFRIEELNIQRHLWVESGELPQQGRQTVQADVVTGGQGQTAGHFAGEVGQGSARIIEDIENLISPRQQGAPGLGQAHFTTQTVEQPHLQLLLQPGDALADGRLGQVQPFPGAGEASGLGDGNKGIEVGQVHSCIPVGYPKHKKYEFELFNVTP
ncbi:hypothetical protein D3C80_1350580 [compost metagenome]